MPRAAGSYTKDPKTGKLTLVERTQPHPDGPAPRDAKGNRLDRPEKEKAGASEKKEK